MDPAWGSTVFIALPILVLVALRMRKPLRPFVAYASAIAAEYLSAVIFLLWTMAVVRWQIGARDGYQMFAIGSVPSLGRRLFAFGVLAAFGALIASLFLGGDWLLGRLTGAWSRRRARSMQ